jgi:hypothetical protein
MGVTFPFFVLVSTMGVLISLVAIPLREPTLENADSVSELGPVYVPGTVWKNRPNPGF